MFHRKSQLTEYTWTTSDVRKYFQNSYFKLKKESLFKYKDLDKTDILFVLNRNYDLDFYEDEDSDDFEFKYWEDFSDIEVSNVTVNVFSKDFSLKKEHVFIDPDDLLLRKYSSGYFESNGNLHLVFRAYNGHNYSKGVGTQEYKMKNIIQRSNYNGDISILNGIFVEYPFNEKLIRKKIEDVVSLENPYGILTKKYVLVNSNTHEFPILKYMDRTVGWYDLNENKLKVFVEGEMADKLRNLYEKGK